MTDMTDKLVLAPEFPELEFQDGPHIYLLDGEQIPSVSKVMEPLDKAKYERVDEVTLARAANRGTIVHNSIENYIKFGFVDIPGDYRGYMNAFSDWWNTIKPVVVGSEIRMYHKLMRYAGTCDLLCYIDEDLTLIDFKTTYSIDHKTCGVQLEAYAQALASHGIIINRKMILQLKNNGQHPVYEFPAKDAKRWRVFGACKTLYDYSREA